MSLYTFPAGKYFLGDPSYAVEEKIYEHHFLDLQEVIQINEISVFCMSYGGGPWTCQGETFGEDTGVVSLIPQKLWKDTNGKKLKGGKTLTFETEFEIQAHFDLSYFILKGSNFSITVLLNVNALPEGKYYLGDPSLLLSSQDWKSLNGSTDNEEQDIEVLNQRFLSRMIFGSAEDKKKRWKREGEDQKYEMPSNQLAIIPEELIEEENKKKGIPIPCEIPFFAEPDGSVLIVNERSKTIISVELIE